MLPCHVAMSPMRSQIDLKCCIVHYLITLVTWKTSPVLIYHVAIPCWLASLLTYFLFWVPFLHEWLFLKLFERSKHGNNGTMLTFTQEIICQKMKSLCEVQIFCCYGTQPIIILDHFVAMVHSMTLYLIHTQFF